MRPCQVCGCASWGPIGDPAELGRLWEFLPVQGNDCVACYFVRCDNCKAIARQDLLQSTPRETIAPPDAGFPGTMAGILDRVMPTMPAPPTRTERLVIALLRSGMFAPLDARSLSSMLRKPDETSVVIAIARDLERQLDQPITPTTDPTAKQPWLVLSFPSREEFDRWVTGFLDAVVYPGAAKDVDYSQALYDRAVSHVQQ